jgi:hypothetical protein
MPGVNVDVTPTLGRPDAVERAIADTEAMRSAVREASEQLAAAQHDVDELERKDVEAAAQRARAGEALGQPPPALRKGRDALEARKREHAARELALRLAEHDLADALTEHAGAWLDELEQAAGEARERGRAALVQLEHALADLSTATSAAAWIRNGQADSRWDRRPPTTIAGSVAASSRHITANNAPLTRDLVLSYAAELVAEPTPPAVAIVEPASCDAA